MAAQGAEDPWHNFPPAQGGTQAPGGDDGRDREYGRDRRHGGRDRDYEGKGGGKSAPRHWNSWRDRGQQQRNAAHNPANDTLPSFIARVAQGEKAEEGTAVVDIRDEKIVSPYQGWSTSEIMDNAAGTINIMTERDQVLAPTNGYFFALHAVYTVQQWKLVINVSVEVTTSVPCARWDSDSASIFANDDRFKPFDWPLMYHFSPTFVDVKLHMRSNLLAHITFRGMRSDRDMTLEKNYWDEFTINGMSDGSADISFTVIVFQGWRITAVTGVLGNRAYALTAGGIVCSLDKPRWKVDIMRMKRNSQEARGNDPDAIDFRFLDATNKIDCRSPRISVPPTWLVASHISGPGLLSAINSIRAQGGRIEGPQQVVHFSQLAEIHRSWFENSMASPVEDVVPLVVAVPTEDPENLHWMLSSRLQVFELEMVDPKALADGCHDPSLSLPFQAMPPDLNDSDAPLPALGSGDNVLLRPRGGERIALQSFPAFELEEIAQNASQDQQPELIDLTESAPPPPPPPPVQSKKVARPKAAAPRLTQEDIEDWQARKRSASTVSGMVNPTEFVAMVDRAVPISAPAPQVVGSSEVAAQTLAAPKMAPSKRKLLLHQLVHKPPNRSGAMATLILAEEEGKLWYNWFDSEIGEHHLLGLKKEEDPLRTFIPGQDEDPEVELLREVPLHQLFAYRSDLQGQPDCSGFKGVEGWKVQLRREGPGKDIALKNVSKGLQAVKQLELQRKKGFVQRVQDRLFGVPEEKEEVGSEDDENFQVSEVGSASDSLEAVAAGSPRTRSPAREDEGGQDPVLCPRSAPQALAPQT